MKYLFVVLMFISSSVYADSQAVVGYSSPVGQYQFYGPLSDSITGIVVTTAIAAAVIHSIEKEHTPTIESTGEIYTKQLMHDDACDCLRLITVQIQ